MLWILTFLFAATKEILTVSTGPSFVKEPPAKVLFYNTTGTVLVCSSQGTPPPTISWVDEDGKTVMDVAGLRQIRKDGSLAFLPFRGDEYRSDAHAASYRCVASNSAGTIGSRISAIRAVIYQQYEIRVYDEYVIRGNSAIMRCHVPSYVKDYVVVTSWVGNDGVVVFPHASLDANSKFSVLPSTGELLVRNAQMEDGKILFKCHVKNTLSGQTESSSTSGKLVVTEPHTSVPPRVTHTLHLVSAKQGDNAVLPCVAQGYPVPRHQWFRSSGGNQLEYLHLGHRHKQQDGVLVLHRVSTDDGGNYVCVVTNDVGEEKVEIKLVVTVPLSVAIYPRQQEVNKGVQVTLNCTVSGQPLDSVEWRKNMEVLSADRRVSFHSRTLLSINSVEQRDKGMYQCFIANEEGSLQASSQLSVLSEPPLLLQGFDDAAIRPGQQASLKCSATGNPLPQITWFSFGNPVRDSHNVRLGDYVSRDGSVVSFVNFTSIGISDGGHYECRVENDYGLVVHSGQMKVAGPPYIRDLSNRTAIAKQSVTVTCPVTSFPIQKITWQKGSKVLPLGRRHKTFLNGTLVIQDVDQIEDVGKYTCSAESPNGEKARREMFLKVLVPPAITPIVAGPNLQEGMRTSLTCSVYGGDPPIIIRWYKDGESFGEGGVEALTGVSIESIDDFISTLVFKSLRRDNSGTYTCVATNDAAAVNFSVPINVNAPPRWKIEPRDFDVTMGSRVVIDCQATGKPEPRVLWKKSHAAGLDSADFKTVISGSRVQTLMNGSLVFREIEPEDSGGFMCEASNGVGAPLSTVINLKVHVPVQFKMPFEALTVKRNEMVRVNCDAEGESPITSLWFKDGQPLKNAAYARSEQVVIERADRSDTGLYSCLASNAYGQQKKTIQLTVQDRPDPPSDLSIVRVSSKSVTLSWKTPFTGNAPITKYIMQLKKATDSWENGKSRDVIIGSERVETIVPDLTPTSDYHFRLAAENVIGLSDYTPVSVATTSEEVPGGPPTVIRVISSSSTSLHASWQAPSASLKHGRIKGYYVGYKPYGSTEPFVYKTVDSKTAAISQGQEEGGECDIENLSRDTKYVVVVQAYNARGPGPLSDEVIAQTLELDPPSTAILRAVALTSSSVRLTWHSENGVNQVSGQMLVYRREGEDWMELQLPPDTSSHTIEELACGSPYQFYIYAFNRAGKGNPSQVVAIKTQGNEPVPPNDRLLIVRNVTSLSLTLSSWGDGGCPIKRFVVQYRRESERQWNILSSSIKPDQEVVILVDLSPGTWYNILMSAFNEAGEAQFEYSVATLTLSGGMVEPKTGRESPDNAKLRSLSIIVPVTSALLVLVAVGIAVFFLVCRKKNGRPSNVYEGVRVSESGGGKGEAIVLGEMEKAYEGRDCGEQVYFPSPYASSKIPATPSSMDRRERSEGHHLDGSPRSFGHSALRGLPHVYDVPQHLRGASSREPDSCSNYQLSPTSLSRYSGGGGQSITKANFVAELEGKLQCNYSELLHRGVGGRPLSSQALSRNAPREADKRWSAPGLYSEKPRLQRSGLALRYGYVYPPQIGLGGGGDTNELSDTECDQDLNDLYDIVCLEDHLAFLHLLASGERPRIVEETDDNSAYFEHRNHIDDR